MNKEKNIVIRGLSKRYGRKQALRDVDLTIEKGMFGLLGRNGAGKTTLMRILASLLKPDQGEVTVCGVPLEEAKEIRRLIGYLPQDFTIYPNMTVKEVLDYLGLLSGMDTKSRKERIPMLLQRVHLWEQKNKKVKSLSGGMRQRLGIAQAMLHDPQVMIVDEPTSGLDPEERIRFRNLLCETAEDKIVLLSTHIVGDIEAACQELAILDEGTVLYRGTVEELLTDARGKVYTARVPVSEFDRLKREYTVTSVHPTGASGIVRMLALDGRIPFEGACPDEPNVEDAYMLCLNRNYEGKTLPEGGGERR